MVRFARRRYVFARPYRGTKEDGRVDQKTILFLHGFASSAQSAKARYLGDKLRAVPGVAYRAIDFNPSRKDFAYMTTTGLINRLRQYVLDHGLGTFDIIGSSYGGLVAVHYAHRFGGVERMLLLAPGLRWLSGGLAEEQLKAWKKAGEAPVFHEAFQQEILVSYDLQVDGLRYLEPIPSPTPMTIIHGRRDTTVPTDDSRAYAIEHPDRVRLIEVEADHDLNSHLDLVWRHVQSTLLGT
jgi:pimeloyl-ACP methyl ester carboxylesterase